MRKQSLALCAAIDIGSNTVRVVVARCTSDGLDILEADEKLVRIGESVNATGSISEQKRDETISVLRQYLALMKKHSAHPILAVATEAIRKANNKDEFLAAIQRETGLSVNIISGDVEAILTFYGATYEMAQEDSSSGRIGVMDLGGGSTELVLAKQMQINWHTSLPIGSGWLHDRYLELNPPTVVDIATARVFLQTYFARLNIKRVPPVLIATGGSAHSLLLLAQRAFRLDSSQSELKADDLLRCEGLLCALSAEEIAQRYQLEVKRARILVAGVLIIRAIMDRFQLHEIHISRHGIREGVLLAYSRYGEQWLEHIEKRSQPSDQSGLEKRSISPYDEEFVQSGRRLLQERTKKMLAWRADVLKHEDIEAVHRMRVASRRLRAVLDAYESICNPKQFKKIYRHVKDIADLLGIARDIDVMIEHLREQLVQSADLEKVSIDWLIKHLEGYRAQHQVELEAGLQALDEDTLLRQIDACLPEGGSQSGKS
jgi:exopolyphosphatase/pppGpp-phosphohydrolase